MIIIASEDISKSLKCKGKMPNILPLKKINRNRTYSTSGHYNETFTAVVTNYTITIEEMSELDYKTLQLFFRIGTEFTISDSDVGSDFTSYFTFDGDSLELAPTYNKNTNTTVYSGSIAVIGTEGG